MTMARSSVPEALAIATATGVRMIATALLDRNSVNTIEVTNRPASSTVGP